MSSILTEDERWAWDSFATAALEATLLVDDSNPGPSEAAKYAARFADAMLLERRKRMCSE
jgi:hypothetical protein